MTIAVDNRRGRGALMVAHCAGMVDLVALSVFFEAWNTRETPARIDGRFDAELAP